MAADQRLLPFTLCFTLCLVFSCSLFSSPAHHNYYYPSLFFNSSTLPTLDLHPHTPYRLRLSDCASRHSCLAPPFLHRTCVDVSPPPPPHPHPPRLSLPVELLLCLWNASSEKGKGRVWMPSLALLDLPFSVLRVNSGGGGKGRSVTTACPPKRRINDYYPCTLTHACRACPSPSPGLVSVLHAFQVAAPPPHPLPSPPPSLAHCLPS